MREVPALARGLRILELLAGSDGPIRIVEIATMLDLPRSATYELVHTLRAHGAVTVSELGQVALGSKLLMLGSAFQSTVDLARSATHVAVALSRQSRETVQVAVLDGRHVLYIAKADSSNQLRLVSAVGRRVPAHCTGLGKAMLAALDPDDAAALLAGADLERMTPNSIVDPAQLAAEFARIRAAGYAFDNGESNVDVSCVAAPVFDHLGHTAAGISISTPSSRMSTERRSELAALVIDAAAQLSADLGHHPGFAREASVRAG